MEQKIAVEEQPSSQEPIEELKVDDWFQAEGELAVDLYQTEKDVVIQSAIAGVRPEELDIKVENDVVTIRGIRKNPDEKEQKQYLHEECFWGPFSRQIFLPEEVDVKNAAAAMKDGVLTLRLPKLLREKTKKVRITKS
jgi:HSP20 family protein